jgi:ribosomal protein S18 acetylase RimI-like enzyme
VPSIRRYRADDWDAFLNLDLETGLQTLRYAPGEDREAFGARWPAVLRSRFGWTDDAGPTADHSALFVLEDDEGGYAGHLWLSEQEDRHTGAMRLWVTTVAIVARHRSRGWGRLLMARAVEEARARGFRSVGLEVDADNVVARKLYEEMGFVTTRLSMIKTEP